MLDTPERRQAMLRSVGGGVEIVRDFLGMGAGGPSPFGTEILEKMFDEVRGEEFADPDLYFRLIQKNLHRTVPPLDRDFESQWEQVTDVGGALIGCFDRDRVLRTQERLESTIDRLADLSDGALLDQLHARVRFSGPDQLEAGQPGSFFYSKINHGYWEHLAALRFGTRGRAYYRNLWPVVDARTYELSGFNRFLLTSALRHLERAGGMKVDARSVFAMAFHAGARPIEAAYTLPLVDFCRGAIIGGLSFLGAMADELLWPGAIEVGDGSLPKRMVLDGSFHPFVEAAADRSDLVMFIAPTHLRRIALSAGRPVEQLTFVCPALVCHELWAPVACGAAAAMAEAFRGRRRVTVFVQAGVMSFPLMVLAQEVRERFAPQCEVAYYDLGQALDVATLNSNGQTGSWVRNHGLQGDHRLRSPFRVSGQG